MTGQLDLFTAPGPAAKAPAATISSAHRRLIAALGGNFPWWCRNGNREMCAAVLRHHGLSEVQASGIVETLALEATP